jgi:hypothetical protein
MRNGKKVVGQLGMEGVLANQDMGGWGVQQKYLFEEAVLHANRKGSRIEYALDRKLCQMLQHSLVFSGFMSTHILLAFVKHDGLYPQPHSRLKEPVTDLEKTGEYTQSLWYVPFFLPVEGVGLGAFTSYKKQIDVFDFL